MKSFPKNGEKNKSEIRKNEPSKLDRLCGQVLLLMVGLRFLVSVHPPRPPGPFDPVPSPRPLRSPLPLPFLPADLIPAVRFLLLYVRARHPLACLPAALALPLYLIDTHTAMPCPDRAPCCPVRSHLRPAV